MTAEFHPQGCACEKCPEYRDQYHPGGDAVHNHEPRQGNAGWIIFILLILLLLAAMMSFTDPNLNFPVISQVVCSLKGATWYGGGILGAPGCYAPW
jgi:hypothetical protein